MLLLSFTFFSDHTQFCCILFQKLKMASDLKNIQEVEAVAEGNSLFSAYLHEELKAAHPDNLIFSPLSLSAVTAMVKLGARGKTANEIGSVFNFPSSNETLGNGYSQVLPTLKESTEGYTLCQANKVYCGMGFEIKPEYIAAVVKSFDAGIEEVDYSNQVATAKTINDWVSDFTNNKISELIDPDSLDASTAMLLINGVYFKGLWATQFQSNSTHKTKFFMNDQNWKEVEMMSKSDKLPYVELDQLDAQVVALPYKGDRLCMIIYLPKQVSGLAKLENGLEDLIPSKILPKMNSSKLVSIFLPRFKIESTLLLKEPLKNLGMPSAFNAAAADFSGLACRDTYISDVVQKAFIEVNEEGTEAVAVTSYKLRYYSSAPPLAIPFRADHPFIFQIVDTHTNFVLFAGCVTNP